MMRPQGAFVCRTDGADLVVLKGQTYVVPCNRQGAVGTTRYLLRMEAATPRTDGPLSVIIADDHTVVRDGIRAVLEREKDEFRVVADDAHVPSTISDVSQDQHALYRV